MDAKGLDEISVEFACLSNEIGLEIVTFESEIPMVSKHLSSEFWTPLNLRICGRLRVVI